MFKVENLSKNFGNKKAVQNVSFEVKSGEVFCLIGPNGSGKTTIVKTIAGLLQPSEGKITVGGFDTLTNPESAKNLIGYIPDEPTVWSSVTGGEFLHIVGALYGLSRSQREKRIPALLKLFGLEGITQDYFEGYSRGNKQKFSILAALLHEPKLLLVDEPIVGLDPTSSEAAQQQFKAFAKNGGAVLMVTHTLPVAQKIGDRIGFLENGKLKAVGTMSELQVLAGLPKEASLDEVYKALV